ncbi:MAG: hypothetical protein LBG83_01690 [Oscillospiraceae bacterium]|jgi:hypothetical protein|nr:hypothetical protein [Oscillospiraceae bacterium]
MTMATYKFNRTGTARKALVGAISACLNQPTKYLGMPSAGYEVGDYRIDKEGTVEGPENLNLIVYLAEQGFEPEASETFHLITPRGTLLCQKRYDTAEEAEAEGYSCYFNHEGRDVYIKQNPDGATEHSKLFAVVGIPFEKPAPESHSYQAELSDPDYPDRLVLQVPSEGFTPEKLDNLCKLVAAKEPLLKAALGVDTLPIQHTAETIDFPWFRADSPENAIPYAQLVTAICRTAMEKQRVTAKPNENHPNMKFAMRTWLITLGLVGPEFKAIRKILTSTLPGNGAYSKIPHMKRKEQENV